jgi:hypothetical protein
MDRRVTPTTQAQSIYFMTDVARLSSTASEVSSWPHAAILTDAVVAPERLPTASIALRT